MSNQETFDTVVAHLRAQGEKSIREDQLCLYRGPDGLKCAIGVLIPDDQYVQEMESHDVDTLWGEYPEIFRNFNVDLLSNLQQVHDACLPEEWDAEFALIAEKFNLSYEAP